MKPEKMDFYQQLLLETRKDIMERVESLRSLIAEKQADTETGGGYPFHMADRGTESMQQEKDALMLSREEQYLKDIDEALERIDEGTFGVCRNCGRDISEDRLRAVPTATLCMQCMKK